MVSQEIKKLRFHQNISTPHSNALKSFATKRFNHVRCFANTSLNTSRSPHLAFSLQFGKSEMLSE